MSQSVSETVVPEVSQEGVTGTPSEAGAAYPGLLLGRGSNPAVRPDDGRLRAPRDRKRRVLSLLPRPLPGLPATPPTAQQLALAEAAVDLQDVSAALRERIAKRGILARSGALGRSAERLVSCNARLASILAQLEASGR